MVPLRASDVVVVIGGPAVPLKGAPRAAACVSEDWLLRLAETHEEPQGLPVAAAGAPLAGH